MVLYSPADLSLNSLLKQYDNESMYLSNVSLTANDGAVASIIISYIGNEVESNEPLQSKIFPLIASIFCFLIEYSVASFFHFSASLN